MKIPAIGWCTNVCYNNTNPLMTRYFHIPTTDDGLKYFSQNEMINIGETSNPRYDYLLNYRPIANLNTGESTVWKTQPEEGVHN